MTDFSERELNLLTAQLDEVHHATLPDLHEAVAETVELHRDYSRRGFLGLAGLAGVGAGSLLVAACSKSSKNTTSNSTTTAPGVASGNPYTGDLAVAALAASLENLAVQTYQAALDAATAGKLGTVPPAVATFAMTAQSQHKDHAGAWNSILTNAGKTPITGVDKTVKDAVVTPGLAAVKDVPSLAKFALTLENSAAATYLNAIQNALMASSAIKIAATIQPVEMQHAAILNFLLGTYPVPDPFAKTDGARPLSDTIA